MRPMLLAALLCGASIVVTSHLSAAPPTSGAIQQDATSVSISLGGEKVLLYQFGDVPRKPYVKELYTPSGMQILRDAPHDHLHHHALMFAIIANGVDFWTEGPEHGKQECVEPTTKTQKDEQGRSRSYIQQELNWATQEDASVLEERRMIEVHTTPKLNATLVTWRSSLSPAEGVAAVKLTGTHYDGLGVRFIQSMDGVGQFLHAAGQEGPLVRGTEHVTPSKWSAYVAPVNGKPVTVAIFDHPNNARHPAGMFTMTEPFSYLSATPNIWKEPLELQHGDALEYCYGVAVWDGETPREAIETLYQTWLDTTKPGKP